MGSPKLSFVEAEKSVKECNRVFYRMLQAKGKGAAITPSPRMLVEPKDNAFYELVSKNPNLISFFSCLAYKRKRRGN